MRSAAVLVGVVVAVEAQKSQALGGQGTTWPPTDPTACAWSSTVDGCFDDTMRFKEIVHPSGRQGDGSGPQLWYCESNPRGVAHCQEQCRECQPCLGNGQRHWCTAISLGDNVCYLSTAKQPADSPSPLSGWASFYDECGTNAPPPSTLSGDPFVKDWTGKLVQIFLPLQKDTMLLQCRNFTLGARAMGSGVAGDHQQWFDRVVISSPDGTEQVTVGAKQSPSQGTQQQHEAELTTIEAAVEGVSMPRVGSAFTADGALVSASRNETNPIPGGFSETVSYATGETDIRIKSARVNKNAGQQKVHLDLEFNKFNAAACNAGPLAEIWGVVPMSVATANMLKPQDA